MLWWAPDDNIPTLATSSPQGTPIDDVGVLGLPTTTPVFSDPLFGDARWGGRIRFGSWPTNCKHGFEGSIWGLLNEDDQSVFESDGAPAFARPFFNVDPLVNGPDSQLISNEDVLRGRLRINTSSEIFGGDIGCRKNLLCCSNVCGSTSTRIDCYAGYRYFRVREGVRVLENLESTSLTGPAVLGTQIDLFDDFQTRNEFHGGTVGMVVMQQYKRLTAEMTTRLSLGNINREAVINGATTVTVPGLPQVSRAGGLLAQPSNIGTFTDDDFAVLPEFQFNLLYNVTRHTQFVVGYSFMWLGDIVRPGDIIDPNVNGLALDPTIPVTGPTRPRFDFQDSEMWLMGLNFGFQFDF